ncbi:MAG: amidase [Solirubrobacteraceae bacterium]
MADLMFRSALELAAGVKDGSHTARELVDASLERIEALDGDLNAFIDVFADEARAAADAIAADDPRPFAGVPIAIKNNRPVAGHRLTFGADFLGDYTPDYDHNVVARLRAAGFVIVGTTTLPEWGILPWTNTKRFGPTRNPWDRDRVSGGSSGGSATAVAAGMVPIAHANDGGGSTRIPAACCGLVGLKPARGRISVAPEAGESFLVTDGVLTRSVGDTAAVLDLLAGPVLGDASWAPPPAEPFAQSAAREPAGLRIGLATTPPIDAPVDPARAQAVADAGGLLESLGHHVEQVDPPWQQPDLLRAFTALFAPAVTLQVAFGRLVLGREPEEHEMEPLGWALWKLVTEELTAMDTTMASAQVQIVARGLVGWMDQYDAIVTPSLAEAPLTFDEVDWRTDDPMGLFARSGRFTPFTALANITGQPAISLPLYEHEGLPVGVQLFGRPAQEGALLALATQLERALPWSGRRPDLAPATR